MPKRIFIVDDSKNVRNLVRTYLENRLEYIDCAEATDGLDAIHRAREVAPDLIVIDLSMPLMSGLEAGAILHDMLPKVPIILFTMHKEIVSVEHAQAFGIRTVVSKMDHFDVLLDEIQKYVGVAKAATA
jgi:DNA-binding NarL/FixJ family response regulator